MPDLRPLYSAGTTGRGLGERNYRSREEKRLQPAPRQKSSTVVVSQTLEVTVILRNAEEFRELLATHVRKVAEAQAMIEA